MGLDVVYIIQLLETGGLGGMLAVTGLWAASQVAAPVPPRPHDVILRL